MKKFFIALAGLLAFTGFALAAGEFQGFPITGASSCNSTVNGVCVQTIPAGPAITGNETVPANTNLTQGQNPATVLIPLNYLGAGPSAYSIPLTGTSITVGNRDRRTIVDPAGTLAALTVVLPAAANLVDGQLWGICSSAIITALTITPGSGTTVNNTVTALTVPITTGAASCPEWVYVASVAKWARIH